MTTETILKEIVIIDPTHINFKVKGNTIPFVRLCFNTLRVIANDPWSELPAHLKEITTAHEIGHREMNHFSIPHGSWGLSLVVNNPNILNPREIEADRYASRLIGLDKYLMGLRGMVAVNKRLEAHRSIIIEYEARIKVLEKQRSD